MPWESLGIVLTYAEAVQWLLKIYVTDETYGTSNKSRESTIGYGRLSAFAGSAVSLFLAFLVKIHVASEKLVFNDSYALFCSSSR